MERRCPGRRGEQRVDRRTDPFGHDRCVGRVELAVEVQECEPVDERPDRGRERFRVGLREGSLDDRAHPTGKTHPVYALACDQRT